MIEYIIWYAVIALVFFASGVADDVSGSSKIEIIPNFVLGVFWPVAVVSKFLSL